MNLVSIFLFFVMMWGFGFSLTSFFKQKGGFEKFFMNLAFGIAIFTILAALFTILRIPLIWYLFLILSLIIPVKYIITKKFSFSFKFKLKKSHIYLLVVLILFIFTLSMYTTGAFSYDLFEDGDPWKHSGIAKYISLRKTALEPLEGENLLQYVDSYPPGYDTLLSVMHQISGNLIWSVKFFNALLISLGIFFFYFFAKQFTGKRDRALFATFVLAMIPCYLSHFIWAHTLVIALIFPLFYSLEKLKENKAWLYPAIVSYAAILLAQPTQAFKISLLVLVYFIVKSALLKKVQWRTILTMVVGGLVAGIVWWFPMIVRYGSVKSAILGAGTSLGVTKGVTGFTLKFHGTADRIYHFADFFFASANNQINNPIGIGVVLMLLLFFAIVFVIWRYKYLLKEKNHWIVISAFWLLFTFLGIHGERLPVQLWAFRFWMLFAIFFSLFVSAGFFGLLKICKKTKFPVLAVFLLVVLVVLGVWFTSGSQKWQLNTVSWEPTAGEFYRYGNIDSWKYVSNLPKDAKVFFPCNVRNQKDIAVLGVDKFTCIWCQDELEMKRNINSTSGEELKEFLNRKNYDYLFIDGNCLGDFGNETILGERLMNYSHNFPLVDRSAGGFVFQI